MSSPSQLHRIPSISFIIQHDDVQTAASSIADKYLVEIARNCQSKIRTRIHAGQLVDPSEVVEMVIADIELLSGRTKSVMINGTGVIVHTNLGRAPVSVKTSEAMELAASNYLPLELDRATTVRGGRGSEVDALLRILTGAERTLVVNNNAAAITLTLATLAAGKEVVISRGEAVEIGGGFRIPEVIEQSGAKLVEVGTTNRTYVADYANAITEQTAVLLKVHSSNFKVSGFTADTSVTETSELAHRKNLFSVEDVGSGCLLDTRQFGLSYEPTLSESIQAGVDIVTASGDKLLGGPQAGLVLGKKEVVDRIARHPLARAVRADKTTLAGIAATLRHYLAENATESIPVWWCISRSTDWLESRIATWQQSLSDDRISSVPTQAVVGGGSLPGDTLPSRALSISAGESQTDDIARILRTSIPGVFPRMEQHSVLIDARTVLPDQDQQLLTAVHQLLEQMGESNQPDFSSLENRDLHQG